jgi:opacity protein-like surface antigen
MHLSFAALPAFALLAVPVFAQDGAYLEIGAGLTSTEAMPGLSGDAAFDAGSAFGALIGYRWEDAVGGLDLGLEFEGNWSVQNFEDQLLGPASALADNMGTTSYILGASLTWPYSEEISFYGGLGAGLVTRLDIKSEGGAASSFNVSDDSAAVFQGKAGIRYNMGANLAWYLQYRRLVSDTVTVEDKFLAQGFDYEFEQDILEVGMRYQL